MLKTVAPLAALLALAAGPAFAIAPHCQAQLQELGSQLKQKSGAKTALDAKYDEAQRLCRSGQDEQAQAMAKQLREEMEGKAPESSGSSVPAAPAEKPSH